LWSGSFLEGEGTAKPFPKEMHALMARETFRSAFVATAKVLNLLQMWKLLEALLAYCLRMLCKKSLFKGSMIKLLA